MLRKVGAEIDRGQIAQFSLHMQQVGQPHVAVFFMMAVGLAIGGDGKDSVAVALAEGLLDALGQIAGVGEQMFEADPAGQLPVVEKNIHVALGNGISLFIAGEAAIGLPGIDIAVFHIPPVAAGQRSYAPRLIGRKKDILDGWIFREQIECRLIEGGFRQPDGFGLPVEAMAEIGDAPLDLRVLIALVRQRHDDVIVALRNRRAVAVEHGHAFLVGGENALVYLTGMGFQPAHQGGAEIEADEFVVVHDIDDAVAGIEDAGEAVGRITLVGDALVPIMMRRRAGLIFNRFGPGILARRLIKMPVHCQVFFHGEIVRTFCLIRKMFIFTLLLPSFLRWHEVKVLLHVADAGFAGWPKAACAAHECIDFVHLDGKTF